MLGLKEETCEVFKGMDDYHLGFKDPLVVIYDDGYHKILMLLYVYK